MKSFIYLLALAGLTLAACGNKPQETSAKELLYSLEETTTEGVQQMKPLRTEQNITWNGKNYRVVVNRTADESLPKVKDEFGDTYIDNIITLTIEREGGTSLFHKAFTKQAFASVLDEQFLTHAMLEGIAFDKATPEGLVFGASVSYPQTDLFMPVSITIAANGSMTLRKEILLEEENTPEE